MSVSLTLHEGLTIGKGVTFGANPPSASFTITSSDFANYGFNSSGAPDYYGSRATGTGGFTSTVGGSYNGLYYNYYELHTPQGSISSTIDSAFLAAGAAFNNYGYDGSIWNVTWGAGSTVINGVARLAWTDSSTRLFISPVDTSDTRYLSGDGYSLPLAGTFNLPATFTIRNPLITDTTGWC
jgi:hypothetical protein